MIRAGSLRLRLLLGAAILIVLAVAAAGVALSILFRAHLAAQYDGELLLQVDALTAALQPSGTDGPVLGSLPADPRFERAYGGRYWQIEAEGVAPLRSRSLWDRDLPLTGAAPRRGEVRRDFVTVPGLGTLRIAVRQVQFADQTPDRAIRVAVALPQAEIAAVAGRFDRLLLLTLALLAAGLVAASAIQVAVGLAPLSRLGRALAKVRSGEARRLAGSYPREVEALVDELNLLVAEQERSLERARGRAADLAHALKTSLQRLLVEADSLPSADRAHARTIREQAARMHAAIDANLARARLQGRSAAPGPGVEVEACVQALLRVLGPQAAARSVTLEADLPAGERYAGDRADLEEVLGNLLDNACKWARSRVRVTGAVEQGMLRLLVEDDGPGLDEAAQARAFARGQRLDESVSGSGLGLALARDIAEACGGWITLSRAPMGGLAASLFLPRGQAANRSAIVL